MTRGWLRRQEPGRRETERQEAGLRKGHPFVYHQKPPESFEHNITQTEFYVSCDADFGHTDIISYIPIRLRDLLELTVGTIDNLMRSPERNARNQTFHHSTLDQQSVGWDASRKHILFRKCADMRWLSYRHSQNLARCIAVVIILCFKDSCHMIV